MAQSIVAAVAAIKRNVAACLSSASIQRICHSENYHCRVRQLGPATTPHAFLLQVLHGNAACSQVVRLARLNCATEAYCQARARLPPNIYQRLLDETSRAARHSCTTPRWHGLYGQRWQIETNFAHLKTTMRMDVLRSKTVAGVRKELAIFAIVYNLVRLVMWMASPENTTCK